MSDRRVKLGRRGERLAVEELEQQGYTIVDRNWRCQDGEVDVVAKKDEAWYFFEVRTRRGRDFGTPEESVTDEKQERMAEVALIYMMEHDLGDVDWRLGLVAIELGESDRVLRLEVYDNLW